jgi:hypothetical protein
MLEALMLILLPHAVWSQSAAPGAEVPPELRPPEGAKLILRAHAKGDQIYACKQQNGQYSWAFKAPEAQLFDERGQVLGRHFAGPTWEASDKSAVTGKMVAHADSPEKDAIPWLLLAAVDHARNGLMSSVSNIQRLNTKEEKHPVPAAMALTWGRKLAFLTPQTICSTRMHPRTELAIWRIAGHPPRPRCQPRRELVGCRVPLLATERNEGSWFGRWEPRFLAAGSRSE